MTIKSIFKSIFMSIKSVAGESRCFDAMITTDSIDREGEVVIPAGIDVSDYKKNPVILWNHDIKKPIGSAKSIAPQGNGWTMRGHLPPRPEDHDPKLDWLPDDIWGLVDAGILKGVSIGFMPVQQRAASTKDTQIFGPTVKTVTNKSKLIEVSITGVGMNQDALITAVHKGLFKAATIKSITGFDVPEVQTTETVVEVLPIVDPVVEVDPVQTIHKVVLMRGRSMKSRIDESVAKEIARAQGRMYY